MENEASMVGATVAALYRQPQRKTIQAEQREQDTAQDMSQDMSQDDPSS